MFFSEFVWFFFRILKIPYKRSFRYIYIYVYKHWNRHSRHLHTNIYILYIYTNIYILYIYIQYILQHVYKQPFCSFPPTFLFCKKTAALLSKTSLALQGTTKTLESAETRSMAPPMPWWWMRRDQRKRVTPPVDMVVYLPFFTGFYICQGCLQDFSTINSLPPEKWWLEDEMNSYWVFLTFHGLC